MEWYLKVWKQYADFSGRARRKEFWMFTLFNTLIGFVMCLIMIPLIFTGKYIPFIIIVILFTCYSIAIFIPSLAVAVRRLHDIGKSGWYFFIGFIPFVGGIILFIWNLQDSEAGGNQWGPNPKEFVMDDYPNRSIHQNQERDGIIPSSAHMHHSTLHCRVNDDTYNYTIDTHRTSIGRERDNHLIINHPTVSRHHAEIVAHGSGFEIIDKGSSNKVIVNGHFVDRATLRDNDMIGLGEVVLTFRL